MTNDAIGSTNILDDDPEDKLAIIADGISLSSDEGPVFGPLSFSVPALGLTNIAGAGGSRRTALALALAGRMTLSEGSLNVLGMEKPKLIQRHVAIAGIDQIDLLERSVTVAAVLRETISWAKPWYSPLHNPTEDDLVAYCGRVYGNRPLPPLNAYVSQLPILDKLLLRISMALQPAHRHLIHMLIMDNLEQVQREEDREFIIEALTAISEIIPVIAFSVNPIGAHHALAAQINVNTSADPSAGLHHPEYEPTAANAELPHPTDTGTEAHA